MSDDDRLSDTEAASLMWVAFAVGFTAASAASNWKRGLLAGIMAVPAAMFLAGVVSSLLPDVAEVDA